MTKEELIIALKELQTYGDPESAHSQADRLLLAYINDTEVTEAFNGIDKWYA